ncbi:signal transduction histidine kinase [Tibeticola sediminis]|uniref:histidine kinase n=1 Tax=Tibeticola sediminis TaxID=1917811 RepID=A0A3N4UA89_9BURK|nr:HAMP domain-containing sensor histidine kinase [Tibeticola sediminis]RPE66698.1 signal transduction histidine kinase [Tibeticola sediminis]
MFQALARRLYLRIWLAVVAAIAVLALLLGWAWRVAADHQARLSAPPREVLVRDASGALIGTAKAERRREPGQPLRFVVTLADGRELQLELPRRPMEPPLRPGAGPNAGPPVGAAGLPGPAGEPARRWRADAAPFWVEAPLGFLWLLALVGVAVAVAVYPVARRLTMRLEALQRGVRRWSEGDWSARVPVQGQDEVAELAARFNEAAGRIETLLSTQRQLLASQKQLLANASHELRSPLARIRMGLELMTADAGAPPAALRAELERSIGELDQLVDEILLASRLDTPETDLGTFERLDLVGLAAEEAARVGATLEVTGGVADPAQLEVRGVAKLLRRLLRNLLENARRYGAAAGNAEIRVRLSREGDAVVVQVCDRGPGVPMDQCERIFEPFYRLPGASEREGGVGLGLALVKSIAERHGGRVRCEPRAGGGACFTVWLPAAGAAAS